MILSGRRQDALERVKRACEKASRTQREGGARRDDGRDGVRVEVLPFDVADLEFVEKEAAGRAVQLFGRVDALVLNAGVRGVTYGIALFLCRTSFALVWRVPLFD